MNSEQTIVEKKIGVFQIHAGSGIPLEWIEACLANLGDFPEVGSRRMAYVDLPPGSVCRGSFIKVIPSQPLRLRKPKRILERFRPSKSKHEAEALLLFMRRGIPVPRLLFYGERRRFGSCDLSVIATERIGSGTVLETINETHDETLMWRCLDLLIALHQQGLSHGDPGTQNIVKRGEDLLFIDLERAAELTERSCRRDLLRFLTSVYRLFESEELVRECFAHYVSRVSHPVPMTADYYWARILERVLTPTRWIVVTDYRLRNDPTV